MKFVIAMCVLLITNIVFAQDQLFKKDNSKIEVKILEITPTEIKYKLFSYQDGPTIIVAKTDVALIIYQNGVHEVISTTVATNNPNQNPPTPLLQTYEEMRAEKQKNEEDKYKELTSTKNFVGLNIMDILNGGLSVMYLREFNSYLNVYVPISVGLADPYLNQSSFRLINGRSNFNYTRKTIEVGLGINWQTSGKQKVSHFIGPFVSFAQLVGNYDIGYSTYNQQGYYTTTSVKNDFVMNRINVMINNGILIRATKNFNIVLNAAIGYRTDDFVKNDPAKAFNSVNPTYNYNFNTSVENVAVNAFKFGLTLGYRF